MADLLVIAMLVIASATDCEVRRTDSKDLLVLAVPVVVREATAPGCAARKHS